MKKNIKLVFASNNPHKLAEVRAMVPEGVIVLSLKDIGFESEIDETGKTLAENSEIKARTIWEWVKLRGERIDGVFADDTGLEIDALDGEPGVYTARWYRLEERGERLEVRGEWEIYAANRAKALRELAGKENRGVQFKTVITLIRGDREQQVEGVVRGQITTEEHGQGGFGYDSIFMPEGYDKTFGELDPKIKNGISHRARAIAEMIKIINE